MLSKELLALDHFDVQVGGVDGVGGVELVGGHLGELLSLDQVDDLQVVNAEQGVLLEHLRVFLEEILDLAELQVAVNQELLLVICAVVLLEERVYIPADELLVNSEADLASQLNDLLAQVILLRSGARFDTADCVLALEVKPETLQTLYTLLIVLPELVGLVNQVVIKHVFGSMLLKEVLILGVLPRVSEDVPGVSDDLGLREWPLAVVLLVREHLLGHLFHLLGVSDRLHLSLLLLD